MVDGVMRLWMRLEDAIELKCIGCRDVDNDDMVVVVLCRSDTLVGTPGGVIGTDDGERGRGRGSGEDDNQLNDEDDDNADGGGECVLQDG